MERSPKASIGVEFEIPSPSSFVDAIGGICSEIREMLFSSTLKQQLFEVMKKQEEMRLTELTTKGAEFKAMQSEVETVLSHAKAAKLYHEHFQPKHGGFIGIVVCAFIYKPLTGNEFDKEAASRALAFDLAW